MSDGAIGGEIMDDEDIRRAFNRFCGSFASGFITDPEAFSKGFSEALRAAYRKGYERAIEHPDESAMVLVKKFGLAILWRPEYANWEANSNVEGPDGVIIAVHDSLNRAIDECVAKIQAAAT